jgi:Dolichyl-phosphate-mannose-protein mannosyltransferase
MISLARYASPLRIMLAIFLSLLVAVLIVTTRHWPLVGDATLIRYVVFLMQHGFAPYRDIIDINMPGAYFADWAVLHIFGSGIVAWRLFDFALLAAVGASMIAIAKSVDRLAGLTAAVVFAVLHAADGVAQTGQRDLTVAVLLLASFALYFRWMRARRLWPIALAAFLIGFSVTIKPTVAPFALALAVLMLALPEEKFPLIWKHLLIAILAFAAPLIATALFLVHEHALHAFLFIVRDLLPFHATLSHRSLGYLITHSVAPLQIFLLPWLFLLIRAKSWKQPQTIALLAAIACGLISYIAQGKGYPYHRYPLIGFLLLAMSMEFFAACRRSSLDRIIGVVSLLGLVLVTAPIAAFKASRYDWRNQEILTMLQSDLNQQGGSRLSGSIQCLDTTAGCLNTLYRMRLVQSTGFLYDCYFFAPRQTPATEQLRNEFLDDLKKSRPQIIVLTDEYCLNGEHNFNKVRNWPQFDDYFTQNYTPIVERHPPDLIKWWSRPEIPTAFRIYKRKAGQPAGSR